MRSLRLSSLLEVSCLSVMGSSSRSLRSNAEPTRVLEDSEGYKVGRPLLPLALVVLDLYVLDRLGSEGGGM